MRPAAARRARHRRLHAARRRRRGAGSRASPSTASATPRSRLAGRARAGRRSTAVVCHSDLERTGWFDCSDPLTQPAARERRLGHARQLPRRADRLPAARRAARLDRRHPGVRAHRLASCTTAPACSPRGCATWPPSRTRTAACPSTCRSSSSTSRARRRAPTTRRPDGGLGRRGGDRAVGAVPALRRRRASSPRSSTACARWVDGVAARAGRRAGCGTTGFQFGDWLDPTAPPDRPGAARAPTRTWSPPPTSPARPSCSAQAADVLGPRRRTPRATARSPPACARRSTASTSRRRAAWPATRRPATRWRSSSRCCRDAGAAPARRARGWPSWCATAATASSTGFVGTPLICDALTHAGALDTAYRLLLQRECPSWLYPVTMGATTIWERWDSMLPDGTVNPGEMTSFNHYALGAVADWLHRTVAGLAPAAPGLPAAARRAAARRRAAPAPRPTTRRRTGAPRCAGEQRTAGLTVDVLVPPEHDRDGRAARRAADRGRLRSSSRTRRRPRGSVELSGVLFGAAYYAEYQPYERLEKTWT